MSSPSSPSPLLEDWKELYQGQLSHWLLKKRRVLISAGRLRGTGCRPRAELVALKGNDEECIKIWFVSYVYMLAFQCVFTISYI